MTLQQPQSNRQNGRDYTFNMQNFKVFVLGDYGTGKSVFASTFPRPMYVFNFDDRIKTYLEKDQHLLTFSNYKAEGKDWAAFEKELREVVKETKDGKYKTVVVDSTTSMNSLALVRAMQLDPKRSSTGGAVWNVHYQMVKDLMLSKLNTIRTLDCNIVLIGHLQAMFDENTIIGFEPALTGQVKVTLPGLFDEVFIAMTKTTSKGVKYFLRTAPKGLYKARSTLSGVEGRLPLEIPNNYDYIKQTIEKEETKNAN